MRTETSEQTTQPLQLHGACPVLCRLSPQRGEIDEILMLGNAETLVGVTDVDGRPVPAAVAERAWRHSEQIEDWPVLHFTSRARGALRRPQYGWANRPPGRHDPQAVERLRAWAREAEAGWVTVEYRVPTLVGLSRFGEVDRFEMHTHQMEPTRVAIEDPEDSKVWKPVDGPPASWAIAVAEGSVWEEWDLD